MTNIRPIVASASFSMRSSLTLVALLGLAACSGGDSDPAPLCTPGSTTSCVCPGGVVGAQACLPGGGGFGMCECGLPDGGPGPVDFGPPPVDQGPPPVCTPGATAACVCSSGASGAQVCLPTGAGFGLCECAAPDAGPPPSLDMGTLVVDMSTPPIDMGTPPMDMGMGVDMGGSPDMGVPPVCRPGFAEACFCGDGRLGDRICNAEGTGYGACVCAPGCSFLNCEGCCDGDICRAGTDELYCGVAGDACDFCGLDFECNLFDLQCTLSSNPLSSTYGIYPTYASVPTTDYFFAAWDAFGGAPDIRVCFQIGSDTAPLNCTGEASDRFVTTFTGGPTASGAPYDIASYLAIYVYDVDLTDDDYVGGCLARRDVGVDLPLAEQTMNCARSDTNMTAGFTVRYRFERL